MDQGRTFCFDVIISATIFARRKSAGGNMIGLNQQRKSRASSRSFGRWVRTHFPEQRLVIEPFVATTFYHLVNRKQLLMVWTSFLTFPLSSGMHCLTFFALVFFLFFFFLQILRLKYRMLLLCIFFSLYILVLKIVNYIFFFVFVFIVTCYYYSWCI